MVAYYGSVDFFTDDLSAKKDIKMKIIQILGMNSTKYGALERFMINLASYSNDDKYVLCYNQKPQSHEFLKDLSVRGIDYC